MTLDCVRDMQSCKHLSMRVCEYARMQVSKYASICKYASMHICKYAHICVELPRTGIYPISCLKTRDTQQLLEKNVDTESSCFFLFFSWSWVPNGQTSVQLDSNYLQKSNRGLQKSRKFRKCQKCGEKHQNSHISTIWPPNENLRALSFLQPCEVETS